MRTWFLTLAALPFVCVSLFLVVVVFRPQDMNIPLDEHRAMHVHADSHAVELIASHRLTNITEGDQLPTDFDHDWGVVHVRRNTIAMGFGIAALYTMYVITVPHLLLLPLSLVMPVIALLQWRRAWLLRLNRNEARLAAAAAAPPIQASAKKPA